jgi:hypothetical protein
MGALQGSLGQIAALIAQIAFWVLLVLGLAYDVVGARRAVIFVALWIAGYVGLPRIAWWTGGFVAPWVAVLDIALVFIVFKGDVRLT